MAIKNNKNNTKTTKSQKRNVFGFFGNKSGSFQTGSGQRRAAESKQKETEKIKTFSEKNKIKMSPKYRKTTGKKVEKSDVDAEEPTTPESDVKSPPTRGKLDLDHWTKKTLRHERRLSKTLKWAAKNGSLSEEKLAEAREKLKAKQQKRLTYCDICQHVQGSHITRFCPTLKCLRCSEMGHGMPDCPFKTDDSDSDSDDSDTEGSDGDKSVAEAETEDGSTTLDPGNTTPEAPEEPIESDESNDADESDDENIEKRQTRKGKKPTSNLFRSLSSRLRPRNLDLDLSLVNLAGPGPRPKRPKRRRVNKSPNTQEPGMAKAAPTMAEVAPIKTGATQEEDSEEAIMESLNQMINNQMPTLKRN